MSYKVVITDRAKKDFQSFVEYLLFEKKSKNSALSLIEDFQSTLSILKDFPNASKTIDNLKFKQYGYRRINFISHRYFIIYRVDSKSIVIEAIFHELQDYENVLL